VITVETVGKIRRRHFVKGESISKIARETGLSRNTEEPNTDDECDQERERNGWFFHGVRLLLGSAIRMPNVVGGARRAPCLCTRIC
jgi:hypothetical protein